MSDIILKAQGLTKVYSTDSVRTEVLKGVDVEVHDGEFVAVVRRAGENYFLGAATDEQPRTLSLPLDFLKPGTKYRATIYADGPDADWKTNPTSYTISEREVSSADTLEVAMAPGGGQAVSFMPAI